MWQRQLESKQIRAMICHKDFWVQNCTFMSMPGTESSIINLTVLAMINREMSVTYINVNINMKAADFMCFII